ARAFNVNGWSAHSPTARLMASDLPAAPSSLQFAGGTATTLEVEWSSAVPPASSAPVVSFEVVYIDLSSDPSVEHKLIISGSGQSAVLSGLTSANVYRVKVRACSLNGCGGYSSHLDLACGGVPDAPSAPVLSSSTDGSVTVAWTFPGSNGGVPIQKFFVYTSVDSGGSYSLDSTVAASTLTQTISCTAASYIMVKVAASNGVGGAYGTDPMGPYSGALGTYCAAEPDTPATAPNITATGSLLTVNLPSPSVAELHSVAHTGWTVYIDDLDDDDAEYAVFRVYDTGTAWLRTPTGVVRGHSYRAYVEICSVVGCSGGSPVSEAATAADAPTAPTNLRATNTTNDAITVEWDHDGVDGGSPITAWLVYTSTDGSSFNHSTTIDGAATNFSGRTHVQACAVVGGVASSMQYVWFAVAAQNMAGVSAQSPPVAVHCSGPPRTPSTAPSLVSTSATAITVGWSLPHATADLYGAKYLGITVCIDDDDGNTADKSCVDVDSTVQTTHQFTSLQAGLTYLVSYQLRTESGSSGWSPAASVVAAAVPESPRNVRVMSVGDTSVTIGWNNTGYNGGSPVTSNAVYKSTDLGVTWSTASSSIAPNILVLATSCTQAQYVYFYVTATNLAGESARSEVVTTRCCDTPDQPSPPQRVSRSADSITVSYSISTAGLHSCSLVGWNVYVDNGVGGPFTQHHINDGSQLEFTASGLTAGAFYLFKVQAISESGVGAESNVVNISAADPPGAPIGLAVINSTDASISLSWDMNGVSDGGAKVNYYYIHATGDVYCNSWPGTAQATVFASGGVLNHTVDCTSISGLVGSFSQEYLCLAVSAANIAGTSARSDHIKWRCSDKPDTPTTGLSVDRLYSSKTSMRLEWSSPGGLHGAFVRGFELDYDDGLNGLYTTVKIGSATQRSYTIEGLTTGRTYRTRYRVVSETGTSLSSPIASHLAAAMPSAPSAPTYYNYTVAGTTMTVTWTWSGDNGGSSIIGWH
ncbi:hypothetical protein FOZ62_026430, partial [Perkinsus olseni]